MCGILGILSLSEKGFKITELIERLKMLEYRGYDSWGIAYKNAGSEEVNMVKRVGEISKVKIDNDFYADIGIAHTRWATHGGVDEINAHPHYSMNKKVFLVHNGIIENFQALKDSLRSEGYSFYSDTDSEIIANLIEKEISKEDSLMKALIKALKKLKGSYALAMIIGDYLVAAAKDSPLIAGKNHAKIFLSSDAKSFVKDTTHIYPLQDGDLIIFDKDGKVEAYNTIKDKAININWEKIEDASKYGVWEPLNGYPHYTIKEINEQKTKLYESFSYILNDLESLAKVMKKAKGIFFVASGSSYNACLLGSYIFSSVSKIHVNVIDAAEFKYYRHFISPETLVIGVSQSGETADVIESIKVAKNKGAKIGSITNTYGSTLYRLSDIPILMNMGSEISVIATKTYSSQVMILTSLAYILAGKKDMLKDNIILIKDQINSLLNQENTSIVKEIAHELSREEHLYLIGRGPNYASALEGALKIKEISYIHAEAFSGGALKHGSIALISPQSKIIAIAPEDDTYEEIISNVMEIKARGGKVIGITTKPNPAFDKTIIVPKNEIFQGILNIIPLQVLAYYLALERNLNPDKPRNLAKSVTVK